MEKEIELKAKIDNIADIKSKLEKLGCKFGEAIQQDDTYYVNYEGDFSVFKNDTSFLRIRKTKDKTYFTLKKPQSNELDCIEKETEISDPEQMREALEIMGYHEVVKVYKTRVKCDFEGMEICLDEVRDLGSFIELEKITKNDAEQTQEELFNFLEKLGIDKKDKVIRGYDSLIYLKNNPR